MGHAQGGSSDLGSILMVAPVLVVVALIVAPPRPTRYPT